MPELPVYVQTLIPVGMHLMLGIFILVLGWQASKWAHRLVVKLFELRDLDAALGRFLGGIAQYAMLAATVIAAMETVGIQTTSLVAIFASAGLAIGLALQGSLANFASGVMILLFRPFNLGDRVTVVQHTGEVVDIGIFATTLVNYDNEKIILSNSAIMAGTIVNYSAKGVYRVTVSIGVAFGVDIQRAMQVLLEAARRTTGVREEPAPDVWFSGFGASSLDFSVRGWCHPDEWLGVLHRMRVNIYEDLAAANIEIPFTQVVLRQAPPPPAPSSRDA